MNFRGLTIPPDFAVIVTLMLVSAVLLFCGLPLRHLRPLCGHGVHGNAVLRTPRLCARSVCMVSGNEDLLPTDDLYEILGAPKTATKEELRRAYRRRARELHPDVPGGDAKSFRRLVQAFETLMDGGQRAVWDARQKKASARERASRKWDDISRGASSRAGRSGERPAGSRWDAERSGAAAREESEARRRSWRKSAFETVWRENMPLDHVAAESDRTAFVGALEEVVQRFAVGDRAPSSAQRSAYPSSSSIEAEELRALLALTNREVLRVELQDATHRESRHRERARWLEGELALAEQKAALWKGATPSTRFDRLQAMERELAFLELANRLRDRLGDQRLALQQLKIRKQALAERLATMSEDAG